MCGFYYISTDYKKNVEDPFVYGKFRKTLSDIETVSTCKKKRINGTLIKCLGPARVSLVAFCHSSIDYESLRIGGLAFAVVLFTLGILLILSKSTFVCVCVSLVCHIIMCTCTLCNRVFQSN